MRLIKSILSAIFLTVLCCNVSMSQSASQKHVVYMLDGHPSSKKNFDKLNENEVAEVIVLKGKSSIALFGKKARNGAVLITSKAAAKKIYTLNFSVISLEYSTKIKNLKDENELLYVIDGVPIISGHEAKLYKIKPTQIKSLTLLTQDETKNTFKIDKKEGSVIIVTK